MPDGCEAAHVHAPLQEMVTPERKVPAACPLLDVATGLSLGRREGQEDAVLADAPQGGAAAIIALADGMGGHDGGALASRAAVTAAMATLATRRDAHGAIAGEIADHLAAAAGEANAAVRSAGEAAGLVDIGTTLVLAVVQERRLHWVSVGDSPLFLIRDGEARRVNEDHSLAAQLDLLVQVGEMTEAEAAAHPGRSCLTSALGGPVIERLDCPDSGLALLPGDTIVAASDGITTLAEAEIAAPFIGDGPAGAAERAGELLRKVAAADRPDQDNTSLVVLRCTRARRAPATRIPAETARRVSRTLRAGPPVAAGLLPGLAGPLGAPRLALSEPALHPARRGPLREPME